jgi:hypothetical protein
LNFLLSLIHERQSFRSGQSLLEEATSNKYWLTTAREAFAMKKLFSIGAMLFLFALTGCAALTPGNINESQSTFDGSTQLVIEPPALVRSSADTWSGTNMEMSLFWNSKMKPEKIILEVYVQGIESFAQGKSLHFNIDGEIVSFTSIDQLTDFQTESGFFGPVGEYHPATTHSSKRYLISTKFLERILNAKDVRIKLDLSKTYIEGFFSSEDAGTAKPAFSKFYARMLQLARQ